MQVVVAPHLISLHRQAVAGLLLCLHTLAKLWLQSSGLGVRAVALLLTCALLTA